MHFVHVDIKEHPWVGVFASLIGAALFAFMIFVAARDYVNFSRQQTPQVLDLGRFDADSWTTRKWVTLTNFRLKCESVEKLRRTEIPEKWVLGPSHGTYVIITDQTGRELMIAVFSGDATCADFQGRDLRGILTTTSDISTGAGFWSTKLSKRTTLKLQFIVNDGLASARNLLLVGLVAEALSVWLLFESVGYLRKKSAAQSAAP